MKEINYLIGDATDPKTKGNKFICHVCNDIGAWGAGFVLALSKKWKIPEISYRRLYNQEGTLTLGYVQYVNVEPDICICNMIGQHNTGFKDGIPLRYDALKECLLKVAEQAVSNHASVHMPRIGCRLAGGQWDKVEEIINETLCENNIDVYVYDLEESNNAPISIDFVEKARITKEAEETLKCILGKEYNNFDQYEEVGKIKDLEVAKLIIKRLLDKIN